MNTREAWLEYVEWLRAEVPLAHANLAPPATDEDIVKVEQVTGVTLPAEVADVWRCNDGQRVTMIATSRDPAVPCIPTLSFLSTSKVIEVWREWATLRAGETAESLASLDSAASSVYPETVRPVYTHPAWLPLWSDPSRADYIGIDLDPGPRGTRGQVINFGRDEEQHAVLAASFGALLQILLEEVRAGSWTASRMPYGKDATIDWFGDPDAHFFNALQARRPRSPDEQVRDLQGRAKKLLTAKDPAAALPLLVEARAIGTALSTPFVTLEADVLEALERWEDADARIAELVERAPKQLRYVARRATNLLDKIGDRGRAAEVIRGGLAKDPADKQLLALQARLDPIACP